MSRLTELRDKYPVEFMLDPFPYKCVDITSRQRFNYGPPYCWDPRPEYEQARLSYPDVMPGDWRRDDE